VNTPATMAGEDVEVTELESEFSLCEEKGRNLVTRRLSRGVVADCFAKSTLRSNYAIVGSAGVGRHGHLSTRCSRHCFTTMHVLFYAAGMVQTCLLASDETIKYTYGSLVPMKLPVYC
jgi:hypothetical protein